MLQNLWPLPHVCQKSEWTLLDMTNIPFNRLFLGWIGKVADKTKYVRRKLQIIVNNTSRVCNRFQFHALIKRNEGPGEEVF